MELSCVTGFPTDNSKHLSTLLREISISSNSKEGEAVGHNCERGPFKDHPSHIWFNLVQQFQRRRFKCDILLKYA